MTVMYSHNYTVTADENVYTIYNIKEAVSPFIFYDNRMDSTSFHRLRKNVNFVYVFTQYIQIIADG